MLGVQDIDSTIIIWIYYCIYIPPASLP